MLSRSLLSYSFEIPQTSPPGSSVHGLLQAGILKWNAIKKTLNYTTMVGNRGGGDHLLSPGWRLPTPPGWTWCAPGLQVAEVGEGPTLRFPRTLAAWGLKFKRRQPLPSSPSAEAPHPYGKGKGCKGKGAGPELAQQRPPGPDPPPPVSAPSSPVPGPKSPFPSVTSLRGDKSQSLTNAPKR